MDSAPLEYNQFVQHAFAQPKFIASKGEQGIQSKGGDRETGVEFTLFFDAAANSLKYKAYGSPYAIAAAEMLCMHFSNGSITVAKALDLEQFKTDLAMPYNYFFILLALEDAWVRLS